MRNAKIIVARFKSGAMTMEQVLYYIDSAMHKELDKKAIKFIMDSIK